MSSPKEILKNKLAFLETETDRAKDINNVKYQRARAHTLGPSGSYHPAKKNLWTEWLLYFNAAKKNETVDKKELKELLIEYKNLFEKFRVSKCPPISQQIEGSPCTIVSKTLSKLSDEYDLNYSRIPPLIELASIKVPAEDFEVVSSEIMLNPRAAEVRRGGKKRKTKKKKKSKKVKKKNKRKTRKGGAQTARAAAEEPTTIPSLTAQAAKKINNKKDLQLANSLLLGDEEAKATIERNLRLINDQENARRVSEQMRRQYNNLQLQNQAPTVAYRNSVIVSRPRPKKVENKTKKPDVKKPAVSKNPKKNPPV